MTPIATVRAESAASAERVWARLLDGRRWHEWNAAVAWMAVDDRLAVGRYITIKPAHGRQTAYRIERLVPGAILVLGLSFGPLARVAHAWTIRDASTGSTIEWSVEIGGPFAGRLVKQAADRSAVEMRAAVARLAVVAGE